MALSNVAESWCEKYGSTVQESGGGAHWDAHVRKEPITSSMVRQCSCSCSMTCDDFAKVPWVGAGMCWGGCELMLIGDVVKNSCAACLLAVSMVSAFVMLLARDAIPSVERIGHGGNSRDVGSSVTLVGF